MTTVTLGDRIKTARKKTGLSQADMARKIDASINAINMLEMGHITNPHMQRMVQIATLCGVSLDYLCRLTDDPTPAPCLRP